jgi:hypothetical protein
MAPLNGATAAVERAAAIASVRSKGWRYEAASRASARGQERVDLPAGSAAGEASRRNAGRLSTPITRECFLGLCSTRFGGFALRAVLINATATH